MPSQLAVNPDNNKQARIFFDMFDAHKAGEDRHPQDVMKELAEAHRFRILAAVPQSLFDGWDFWIEFDEPPELPPLFRGNLPWKPVGQA